jgi:RIP metalloprotease RseP
LCKVAIEQPCPPQWSFVPNAVRNLELSSCAGISRFRFLLCCEERSPHTRLLAQIILPQRPSFRVHKVLLPSEESNVMLTSFWSLAACVWPFLFVLSLVVFFHELGHFLIARWCGVKVETFSLGFGPKLFVFDDRYGTHWQIAALPLGGFVKFHGDANDSSMPGEAFIEAMSAQERKVGFSSQKIWKRAAIVAAGPMANFLLAIVIFSGIFYLHGHAILPPVIESVATGSAAEAAGFRPGDRIISIDGAKIESFEEMQRIVQAASDKELSFVRRACRDAPPA